MNALFNISAFPGAINWKQFEHGRKLQLHTPHLLPDAELCTICNEFECHTFRLFQIIPSSVNIQFCEESGSVLPEV